MPRSPLVEIRGLIRPSSELTNIVWYEYDAPDMPSCPWNEIGTLCFVATSQTKILPFFASSTNQRPSGDAATVQSVPW